MLEFAAQVWETFVFHVMRSSSVCSICKSQSPLTFKERCERGGFIDWMKKWNVWFMCSRKPRVNLCHWIHMLGLSQHLFAEQNCDLVMTSGNVSFQQRRSSELGGGGVGRGRRGDSQGKAKKKKKKGRHRMRNSERGSAPKFQLFHNSEFMCWSQTLHGVNDEQIQEVEPGGGCS